MFSGPAGGLDSATAWVVAPTQLLELKKGWIVAHSGRRSSLPTARRGGPGTVGSGPASAAGTRGYLRRFACHLPASGDGRAGDVSGSC